VLEAEHFAVEVVQLEWVDALEVVVAQRWVAGAEAGVVGVVPLAVVATLAVVAVVALGAEEQQQLG